MRTFSASADPFVGKSLLITGGTGSFGRRLTDHLLTNYSPRKVIIFSRDELKQYEMQEEIKARHGAGALGRMRFFLGDVRDRARLMLALRGVNIVVHAAALKQVPAAEYNPSECIHTNVLGAENVVWAALSNHVENVVALSTDKACNPINIYGASKLASDKIFVSGNNLAGDIGTRFCVVRYGNVVGSRGSVLPFFRRLLAAGAETLPITDERMTRFWITLDQGVEFVISSLEKTRGGEIFVPKIPSMRMVDFARVLSPRAKLEVVGIRPGEKLHEMMISSDDARRTTDLGDRYAIEPDFVEWGRLPFADDGSGRCVDDHFAYASDSNEEWLDEEGLKELLDNA